MSKWEHCPECAFSAGHAERCRYYGLTIREAQARHNREKAERIALLIAPDDAPAPRNADELRDMLATAALAALTEKGDTA